MTPPSSSVAVFAAALLAMATPLAAQQPSLPDIVEAWLQGPHGDYSSPSFTHWNEDGHVPEACAACHSETGMLDWLGADGTAAGVVNHPGTINTVIGCASCHVAQAEALDAIRFPAGMTVDGLARNATCIMCHAGRASGDAVAGAVSDLGLDTVSADLAFVNPHYGLAASMILGAEVRGGFEYAGRRYAGAFRHVPSANTCISCHEPHSTEVATQSCTACHQGSADIREIRTQHADFDGDGVTDRGIRHEIAGLHALLNTAIRAYAQDVAGQPIGYAGGYPYFFIDGNADGEIDAGESIFPNRYDRWTPRLLMAAYNYQFVAMDPGAWVHNPRYALQLLHDSVVSLSERVELDIGDLDRP